MTLSLSPRVQKNECEIDLVLYMSTSMHSAGLHMFKVPWQFREIYETFVLAILRYLISWNICYSGTALHKVKSVVNAVTVVLCWCRINTAHM